MDEGTVSVYDLDFTISDGEEGQPLLYDGVDGSAPVVYIEGRPLVALRHWGRFRDTLTETPSFGEHRSFGQDTLLSYYHGIDDRSGIKRCFISGRGNDDRVYQLFVDSILEQSCCVCGSPFARDGRVVGIGGSNVLHASCAPTLADDLDVVWNAGADLLGDVL